VLAAAPAPAPRAKKPKQRAAPAPAPGGAGGTFSFHPEDAHVQAAAAHAVDYSFTHAPPREQDAFGLDTGGRMMLVPADRFAGFVAAISEAYAVPA
jgi:protein BCP1